MARVVALTGQKGGSGKSPVATSLAAEAPERGLLVVLADLDPQGSARTWGSVALEQGHEAPAVVAMGPEFYRPGQLAALTWWWWTVRRVMRRPLRP